MGEVSHWYLLPSCRFRENQDSRIGISLTGTQYEFGNNQAASHNKPFYLTGKQQDYKRDSGVCVCGMHDTKQTSTYDPRTPKEKKTGYGEVSLSAERGGHGARRRLHNVPVTSIFQDASCQHTPSLMTTDQDIDDRVYNMRSI